MAMAHKPDERGGVSLIRATRRGLELTCDHCYDTIVIPYRAFKDRDSLIRFMESQAKSTSRVDESRLTNRCAAWSKAAHAETDPSRSGASERAAHGCDLMLAIGTKLSVYPIAGVVPVAKSAGARVVIVNAEPTEMDEIADIVLRGSISRLLPLLAQPRD